MNSWPPGGSGRIVGKVGVPNTQDSSSNFSVATTSVPRARNSWSTVIASVSDELLVMQAAVLFGSGDSGSADVLLCDVGVGAVGSEVVQATVAISLPSIGLQGGHAPFPVPVRVPAGARIAVRAAFLLTSQVTTFIGVLITAPLASLEGN